MTTDSTITRRGFLKWGAAAAALSTGLAACSPQEHRDQGDEGSAQDILTGGEWVTVPCTSCSQFRCVNRAYMVDGVPIRQKTDDSHEYSLQYPQWRSCIRGRSTRWSVFSPARLKYPMKRKNWSPGGGKNVNGHLRGKDEWERISWDEAIEISAAELKRIAETYGTDTTDYGNGLPILNLCYTVSVNPRFLNAAGIGTLPMWGQNSTGGWPTVTYKMIGNGTMASDRSTIAENSELVVLWGCNYAWSKYGSSQVVLHRAKERGAKIIAVDPWFNPGNSAFADEWVPCRPGTDIVLLLAIAHELIEQGLVDQDFLDRHTVGYDEESMHRKGLYDKEGNPISKRVLKKDANGQPVYGNDGLALWEEESVIEEVDGRERHKFARENFKDYVLGTYDGVPKTAEWATRICGTPVDQIRSLAHDMGTIKPMAMLARQGTGRHYYGANMAQAFYTVGWMTGNVGKPGALVENDGFTSSSSVGMWNSWFAAQGDYFGIFAEDERRTPPLVPEGFMQPPNPKADVPYGAIGYPWDVQQNYDEKRYYGVCFAETWDAVLRGKHHDFVHGMKDVDIKAMIKLHNGNKSNQIVNANKAIQAHRSVEFVLAMDMYMTTTTRYADIVLPCTSYWEEEAHINFQNPEMCIGNANRIIEPMFECKSSLEVDALFLKHWGFDPMLAYPTGRTTKDTVFDYLANTWVVKPNGTGRDPLVSFTEQDLSEIGVEADASKLAEGRMTFQEFKERGFYSVEPNERIIPFKGPIVDFVADADHADPTKMLSTQTGLLEIYSQNLSNYYQVFGLENTVGPRAEYVIGPSGYEESTEGVYPYQFVNVHPFHRCHSTRTDNQNLLSYYDDVMFVNPIDAEREGLEHGDTALFTSRAGKVLRRIAVETTVMPGVIVGTEGASIRLLDDEKTTGETSWDEAIDYGGNANTLCESYLVGQGHMAYNTVIVDMEKWTGEPLKPNYQWDVDLPACE